MGQCALKRKKGAQVRRSEERQEGEWMWRVGRRELGMERSDLRREVSK